MAASSSPRGSAHGLSRSKSCWPSSTTKSLGTRTLPCPTTVLRASVPPCRAPAPSRGGTSPLTPFARAPSTKPPSRRSNRWRTPTKASFPRRRVIVSACDQRLLSPPVGPSRAATLGLPLGRVAEWQTRTVQVRVSVRTWGFNSPLAHHICAGQSTWTGLENWRLLPNFYRTLSRASSNPDGRQSVLALSAVVVVTYVAASTR